jgi:hypothetical protein
MKGDLIFKILKIIETSALTTADIFAIFISGFAESDKKMKRDYGKNRSSLPKELREKQKFYNLLNYLQREGLVEKRVRMKIPKWFISEKGRAKLKKLRERFLQRPSKKDYEFESSKDLKIISFDIPEIDRKKEIG